MAKDEMKDVHSMIGADAVIQGNISCKGSLAIFGKVYGDVNTEGSVRIAKGGEIHGNIHASDAQIGGLVDGKVVVENRAILGSESNLKGDLVYRSLIIEEGAQFQGHCVLAGSESLTESNTGMDSERESYPDE
ncbi:MAG: polymer-forming cytoskeletal protein [Fidelibacterota bacterium]